MTPLPRDDNRAIALGAVSEADHETVIAVEANPTDKSLKVDAASVVDQLAIINSLVPAEYDYISLSYTDGNLTSVVYKTGGSGGTTVSTLTLGYDGSNNLTSVTKS